jgi:hypothetical protein
MRVLPSVAGNIQAGNISGRMIGIQSTGSEPSGCVLLIIEQHFRTIGNASEVF